MKMSQKEAAYINNSAMNASYEHQTEIKERIEEDLTNRSYLFYKWNPHKAAYEQNLYCGKCKHITYRETSGTSRSDRICPVCNNKPKQLNIEPQGGTSRLYIWIDTYNSKLLVRIYHTHAVIQPKGIFVTEVNEVYRMLADKKKIAIYKFNEQNKFWNKIGITRIEDFPCLYIQSYEEIEKITQNTELASWHIADWIKYNSLLYGTYVPKIRLLYSAYKNKKVIELANAGYGCLMKNPYDWDKLYDYKNTLCEITDLPKDILEFAKKHDMSLSEVRYYQNLLTVYENLTYEDYTKIKSIFQEHHFLSENSIFHLLHDFDISIDEAIDYVTKTEKTNYIRAYNTIIIWREYLTLLKGLYPDEYKLHNKFPISLKLEHDRLEYLRNEQNKKKEGVDNE